MAFVPPLFASASPAVWEDNYLGGELDPRHVCTRTAIHIPRRDATLHVACQVCSPRSSQTKRRRWFRSTQATLRSHSRTQCAQIQRTHAAAHHKDAQTHHTRSTRAHIHTNTHVRSNRTRFTAPVSASERWSAPCCVKRGTRSASPVQADDGHRDTNAMAHGRSVRATRMPSLRIRHSLLSPSLAFPPLPSPRSFPGISVLSCSSVCQLPEAVAA